MRGCLRASRGCLRASGARRTSKSAQKKTTLGWPETRGGKKKKNAGSPWASLSDFRKGHPGSRYTFRQ